MAQRLLIDCDPGIDDALALYALLACNDVTIQAITTVFGNVAVRQATRNVVRLLQLAELDTLPRLGEGSEHPLTGSRLPRRMIHGRDGLGDLGIAPARWPRQLFDSTKLVTALLRDQALETILALGPLTNLAHTFASSPKEFSRVRQIVVMGGVIVDARHAEATEFNLASDPSAAQCVLSSRALLRWVPWNVASSVVVPQGSIERLRASHPSNLLAQTMASLMAYAARARVGVHGAVLPDAVAAALALDPSLGVWRQRRLTLEPRGRSGRLRVEPGLPNAQVCESVDRRGVLELVWRSWTTLVRRHAAHP